jgi:hypothetical protein
LIKSQGANQSKTLADKINQVDSKNGEKKNSENFYLKKQHSIFDERNITG